MKSRTPARVVSKTRITDKQAQQISELQEQLSHERPTVAQEENKPLRKGIQIPDASNDRQPGTEESRRRWRQAGSERGGPAASEHGQLARAQRIEAAADQELRSWRPRRTTAAARRRPTPTEEMGIIGKGAITETEDPGMARLGRARCCR